MNKHTILDAELCFWDAQDAYDVVELSLPATPWELMDAINRARFDGSITRCTVEILNSEPENLAQLIPEEVTLTELNLLAQRIAALAPEEVCAFEGLVLMEFGSDNFHTLTVERLINLADSTKDCHIAYGVHRDEELGQFYLDNDFPVVPDNLPKELYEMLDRESLGRKARMAEKGVFAPAGYVVLDGEISQSYKSGIPSLPQRPDYTILLRATPARFSNQKGSAVPEEQIILPTDSDAVFRAVGQLEEANMEDCVFSVVDCMVPHLGNAINAAMEDDPRTGFEMANQLALRLNELEQRGDLLAYKALVNMSPQGLSMESALELTAQVEDVVLLHTVSDPGEYGQSLLRDVDIPLKAELLAHVRLYHYGEAALSAYHAELTEYGAIQRKDGQPMLFFDNQPRQGEMEMS